MVDRAPYRGYVWRLSQALRAHIVWYMVVCGHVKTEKKSGSTVCGKCVSYEWTLTVFILGQYLGLAKLNSLNSHLNLFQYAFRFLSYYIIKR